MSQPKTWQELLDFLTSKAEKDGILFEIQKFSDQENVMKVCFREEFFRNKLMEWITTTIGLSSFEKSPSRGSSFRQVGNDKFRSKDYPGSLIMYNESVQYAPDGSEDLALALANRSAALFHLNCFEESLRDIELSLLKGYPVSLQYKLYTRQGQYLKHLGRYTEAISSFQNAQKSLAHLKDPLMNKKSVLQSEIDKALADALSHVYNDSVQNCGTKKKLLFSLPEPNYGENQKFAYASEALDLRHNDEHGRHVITKRDVKMGDILFVEKPFAFVLLPDQCKRHCHHCCKAVVAAVPCCECTEGGYCSEFCRKQSWEEYHKWECHGALELMHSIGIAHLGLRVVLKAGSIEQLRKYHTQVMNHYTEGECYGNKQDNYLAVYQLMPHLEDMHPEDLLQYGLTAVLLILYLRHHTNYFQDNKNDQHLSESNCGILHENTYDATEDMMFVGGLILRHIAQLVCNGHAITKLETTALNKQSDVVTENQVRVAAAIFPSASMVNHSCDPNIINSFYDQYLIVRASKNILCGEEVYNCYGPHFRWMSHQERQESLKSQYFFTCTCDHCSQPVEYDFQERFSALLCSSCAGPLIGKGTTTTVQDVHHMVCSDCGCIQTYSNLVESVFKAHELFNEGCLLLERGNVSEALKKLQACQNLRETCLYKSNRDLLACRDQIAKCYAVQGEYDISTDYLLQNIPAIEEQFGSHSVELANELQKLSDVMIRSLRQDTFDSSNAECFRRHKRALECVQKAKRILDLHYGIWNTGLQEILEKEQWLEEVIKS